MTMLRTARSVLVGLVTLPFVSSLAVAGDPCGAGLFKAAVRGKTLELRWDGKIDVTMAEVISHTFFAHRSKATSVRLSLNSCGGWVPYMERTIHVLETLKGTHELTTIVDRGDKCGSACVPVFLAGTRRLGAFASLWFFHPVAQDRKAQPRGAAVRELLGEATDVVIDRYFTAAGVSPDWILYMRRTLRSHDLWQTGRDLWDSRSGTFTETLDNLEPREEGPVDLPPALACGSSCRG